MQITLKHVSVFATENLYGKTSRFLYVCASVQFVIAEDGACGLCYEHSPSEGIAVVQLIEHLLAYMYVTNNFFWLRSLASLCLLATYVYGFLLMFL